jgi:hypothetical protein
VKKSDRTGGKVERVAVALLALIGGGGGFHAVFAQDAAAVTVEVGDCVKLQTPEERLACYGRHVDAAVKQNSAASTTPPPSATATAAPPSDKAGHEPKPKSADDQSAESSPLVATVIALKETVPNAHLITLDNGQVWRQNYPQWYPLQPGQRVTLSRTKWGAAYRLSAEGLRGFIQVERVR